jgi:hypothetical protein
MREDRSVLAADEMQAVAVTTGMKVDPGGESVHEVQGGVERDDGRPAFVERGERRSVAPGVQQVPVGLMFFAVFG